MEFLPTKTTSKISSWNTKTLVLARPLHNTVSPQKAKPQRWPNDDSLFYDLQKAGTTFSSRAASKTAGGTSVVSSTRGEESHHRDLLELLLEQDFDNPQEEQWFYVYNVTMTIVLIICVAIVAGLFLGGVLSIGSSMVSVKLIREMGLFHRPHAQLTGGIVVLEDITMRTSLWGIHSRKHQSHRY